jgi:hypothetical protein
MWFDLCGTGAGVNDIYRYRLFKNGVMIDGGPKSKGTILVVGWTWYIDGLVAGDDLSIRVTNTVDNDDLTAEDGSIYLRKED